MNRPSYLSASFRALGMAASFWAAAHVGNASAASFDIGDITTINVDNLFTVGAAVRTQDRDLRLISKSSVAALLGLPPPCVGRVGDDGVSGPDTSGNNEFFGDTCTTSADNPDDPNHPNQVYVRALGSFSPNADDENQNFDKGDLVGAVAKLTTDFSFDVGPVSFFARTLGYFDTVYADFEQTRFDTTLQPRNLAWGAEATEIHGVDLRLLDAYATTYLPFIGDRELSIKVGKQVLNWGESSLLLLNSLNSINPVSQPRLVAPGFDLKELSIPVGMVYLQTDLTYTASIEGFYQYEWVPLETNAPGHFGAPSDILGAGGDFAMLSFGKAPEDPLGLYQPNQNPDDPIGTLQSTASRTIYHNTAEERRRLPSDGGQYGAALKLFLEDFNNGTELAFYFANYHSRVPSVSATAADETCVGASGNSDPSTNLRNLLLDCEYATAATLPAVLTQIATTGALPIPGREPVPVDTSAIVVEYPEDVRMYGVSFNTTIGDYALSGEYAFRDNLPIQVHSTDLVFASLQPAFPEEDYDVGIAVIPGRRSAVPDFVETDFRGNTARDRLDQAAANNADPNYYIRGWEPMKIGQLGLTVLKTIGGDNPLGAAQIILLLEMGYTHVVDFPDVCTLQTNGGGTNTHISHGADGTAGCVPGDIQASADPDADDQQTLRQNPTTQDPSFFGTKDSYGYRFINLNRFDNVLFGANLETLFIARHDLEGNGPGLGQNFSENRKQFDFGVRWDYLSRFIGELRYTWFTGGGTANGARDKDQAFLYFGYQF